MSVEDVARRNLTVVTSEAMTQLSGVVVSNLEILDVKFLLIVSKLERDLQGLARVLRGGKRGEAACSIG